jgi:hypothetical protein
VIGKVKRDWQDVNSILGIFGKRKSNAKKAYQRFIENGVEQGKRPELTGGGLLRSIGGWTALKMLRRDSVMSKGDERVLGDSDFVEMVLREADEQLERKYRLKAKGFTIERIAERVAQLMDLPVELIWEKSRRPKIVQARSLLCYWAFSELGISMTDLAKRLELTQPAVSIAVRRGERIAEDKKYVLIER